MSLSFLYDKLPENLCITKWVYKGEEKSCMGVKLQALIYLTMQLRRNYCGGAKAKAEVKKRFNYLKENGLIEPIYPSEEMVKSQPEYWQGAVKSHFETYSYLLTEADIDSHWGLWTNSHYSNESWTAWKKMADKVIARNKGE